MGVMRGCHLAKAEPIRGLSSKSGKFRQSGNYFWIKNIKGFGFRFFPHLELTCLLRIHCGAHGCESNAIHKIFYPVTISVASHFMYSRWLFFSSSVPCLKRPGKRTGSSPFQAPSDGCHSRDRRHRAVRCASRGLLRSPPLKALWIQSAQARTPVFEFLDS